MPLNPTKERVAMNEYIHLTENERYQIYSFLKENFSIAKIAKNLGRNRSTIYREIRRNSGERAYRPQQAQNKYEIRKVIKPKSIKLDDKLKLHISQGLEKGLSPEQISYRLKKEGLASVSHEAVYQYIWNDKQQNGNLYKLLRHSNKKRKKRYGSYDKRGQIRDRISIDKRPKIVDKKKRVGDWEIDTVVGKNHKGFLITAVERKTKYVLVNYVPNKSADLVAFELIKMLSPYKEKVHTITADNGKEFANHKYVSKKLGAKVYFAHPYHSWERGLNENTNGLIRQYFPKGMSFEDLSQALAKEVEYKLNSRPRKSLNYATPIEKFLGKRTIVFKNEPVALVT